MTKIRILAFSASALWFGLANNVMAQARRSACAELESTKPQFHLEYLERERSTLTAACVAYAAEQIALRHYVKATKTLVKYLDYRMPDDPALAHLPPLSPG